MNLFNRKYLSQIFTIVSSVSIIILFSLVSSVGQAADGTVVKRADIFAVVEQVKKNENLNNLKKCPGDYAPQQKSLFPSTKQIYQDCIADLPTCYQLCNQNQPYACYYLARTLQDNGAIYEAEKLFQRSCELGAASGCTNRAAGMKTILDNPTVEQKACFSRSFKKSCEWNDPWGCTMYAYELVDNLGAAKAKQKVLKVLEGSCKHGISDPACEAAENLKEFIKNSAQ